MPYKPQPEPEDYWERYVTLLPWSYWRGQIIQRLEPFTCLEDTDDTPRSTD